MQIARIERKREVLISGKIEEETLFIITNIPDTEATPERLLTLKRQYWEIENLLHYRKDFVFEEDRSTIRAGHGPENMSALRNFVVSLLMANNITNVKRCVAHLRYADPSEFCNALLSPQYKLAA